MRGHGESYEKCAPALRAEVDARHLYLQSWRESGLCLDVFLKRNPRGEKGWSRSNINKWAKAWERSGGERDSLLLFVKSCGPMGGKAADWGKWTQREIELALQLLGLTAVSVAERIGAKKNTVHRVITREREGGEETQRIAHAVRRIVEDGLLELTMKRKKE